MEGMLIWHVGWVEQYKREGKLSKRTTIAKAKLDTIFIKTNGI
jgi:hypothetical protein